MRRARNTRKARKVGAGRSGVLTGVAVVLALICTALVGAVDVSAHAYLDDSTPEDGAKLPSAPTAVTLRFTEPVIPESVWIQLKRLEPEEDVELEAPDFPGEDGMQVNQPLPGDLGLGSYQLQWAVVSSVDGHPSIGGVAFEVTGFVSSGVAEGGDGGAGGGVRWADLPSLLVRWISYVGVLAFVGTSLLAWRLGATSFGRSGEAPEAGADRRQNGDPLAEPVLAAGLRRRGRRLGALSLLVGAAGWFGNLSLNTNLSLLSLASLRHSPFQLIALLMTAGLAAFALLFFWVERPGRVAAKQRGGGRADSASDDPVRSVGAETGESVPAVPLEPLRFAPLWTAVGLVALLGFALGGHAAAIQGPRLSSIVMDWVHLAAAGAWLGGMAYLLAAVFPAAKAAGSGGLRAGQASRIAADRFTAIALVSIGLLVVTGIFSSELRFSSVADIPRSLYGRSLIVKLSAFALMGVAASVHHQLLRPRLRRWSERGADDPARPEGESGDGPRRTADDARGRKAARRWRFGIAIEALLGVVVLAAVAVMVTYPVAQRAPARQLTSIPEETGRALTLAEDADRLLLTATGFPLQPGENLFRVTVSDPFNLSLKPEQVDLRLAVEPVPDGGGERDGATDGVEPETLRAVRQEDGSFLARVQLGSEGMWRLSARVTTPDVSGGETSFLFPVPVPEAKLLMDRAADVMEEITDFKVREELADGMTTLHNVYELSSGKRMAYYVENGLVILFTEDTRYTKPPGQDWVSSPAPEERLGLISYLKDAQDVHATRIVEVNGTPTFEIHFYDERIRARMAVWLATDTYRPVKLKMMYPGHYMIWDFYDMGVPNRIEAPI